jgi:hypothetical protein
MAEAPFEIYDIRDEEAVALGEALVLSSGKLTKCDATTTPEFIAMKAGTGVEIPVIRIDEKMVFETTFAADATDNAEGTKVTIHTDGLQVTATATNGVFTITKKLGSGETGTKVLGMFRR